MKKLFALILALTLLFSVAYAQGDELTEVGSVESGFVLDEVTRFELVNADIMLYTHQKTGAKLMFVLNEDIDRAFEIGFHTPKLNDMGIPHVFEHSVLDGSEKYPSRSLFFNLSAQTYNTYMNAATSYYDYTYYPIASLSEAQLLALADYYLDSVFHPIVLNDESIFKEEAWRYSLNSPEDELTVAGTVYSEMRGAYTLNSAANSNYIKTLFPGSTAGNNQGGIPSEILNMTWKDITDYHAAYYVPSNSLTIIYGKIEDRLPYLELCDAYFSEYDDAGVVIRDDGYAPITGPVTAVFDYPVEAGSDTELASVIYYGMVCPDATEEDINTLDLMTTLLADPSSPYIEIARELLPSATVSCYVDTYTPEFSVLFSARGVNADDAETFREVVDKALNEVAENGFDDALVDAVGASVRMSTLLVTEQSGVGVELMPNFFYYWANADALDYVDSIDLLERFEEFQESKAYSAAISKHLIGNELSALVTTKPLAGAKEIEDAALAARLAEIKASMTEDEIAEIVAETLAIANPSAEDSSALVASLQAVTVESLPEEVREFAIRDELGEDGLRRMAAEADVTGVGTAYYLLDASGIPQEDLHWYALYVSLLGELPTEFHTRAEVSSLMRRYHYNGVNKVAVYNFEDEDLVIPYLRGSFTALDEDLGAGYDLLYELLYHTKFDDAKLVLDYISRAKSSLRQSINSGIYNNQLYRAVARDSESGRYYDYMTFLDYYNFLGNAELALTENPDEALNKLSSFKQYFNNRAGAISGYVGSDESIPIHSAAADAFFAKLDYSPIAPVEYEFAPIPESEAFIVDSAVQYNLIFASNETLGIEDFTADLAVISSIVSDKILYPLLREQYGAYGVFHNANDDGIYVLSYRDPNVKETFAVYSDLPARVSELALDQAALDGYLTSVYVGLATPVGELSGGLSALISAVTNDPNRTLEYMREIKELKAEDIAKYAELYQKLIDLSVMSTSGGAAAINQNSELYELVHNPFGAVDETQIVFTDIGENSVYFDAVRFAFENKFMSAAGDSLFAPDAPATLGEEVLAMYSYLGGSGEPADAIAYLAQYGIVPADGDPAKELTREEMALYMRNFYIALSADESMPEDVPEFADANDIDPACKDAVDWCVGNDLLIPTDADTVSPKKLATRAELAFVLYGLFGE